jgi:hypothetical protein
MGSALAVPAAARASEEGRRNTTLALGAGAAYLLLTQKNKLPGIAAAAGTAYAYKRYDDSVRARRDRDRRYGLDWDRDSRRSGSISERDRDGRYYRSSRDWDDDDRFSRSRKDNGKHKGWYKNKAKGKAKGHRH